MDNIERSSRDVGSGLPGKPMLQMETMGDRRQRVNGMAQDQGQGAKDCREGQGDIGGKVRSITG